MHKKETRGAVARLRLGTVVSRNSPAALPDGFHSDPLDALRLTPGPAEPCQSCRPSITGPASAAFATLLVLLALAAVAS